MDKKELIMGIKYFFRFIPDAEYIKLYFRLKLKRKLDLNNSQTLNEKLQWLKFNYRKPLFSLVSDKYAVREYVKEKIGEKYLIPLIKKYEKFEQIDFDELPNKFIIKCNHDSGGYYICKEKAKLNRKKAKKKINTHLKRNFYYIGREWQYKNIKPCIIIEKLMLDENNELPEDYKITCFNGKVDNIMVCKDRFSNDGVKFYFFDKDWNFLRYNYGDEKLPKNFSLKKPQKLEEMVKIAEKLSEDFIYARIDLYDIKNEIYFGEITLSPNSGFDTDITYTTDKILGEKLIINEYTK